MINRPMIFAAANKEEARAKWKSHFENRTVADARPKKPIIKQAADGSSAEILLYDEIGFWGITAKEFVTELSQITAPTVTVRINSPGGDVFDGLAIYSALQSYKGTVNTIVEGLAASAASFIALAGKSVSMSGSAMMMIHKAWGVAIGNSTDMADMVSVLEKIDGQLAAIYAKKTGQTTEQIAALMAGESDGTWFTAEEAQEIGLIDAVINPVADDPAEEVAEGEKNRSVRVSNMRRRLTLASHE